MELALWNLPYGRDCGKWPYGTGEMELALWDWAYETGPFKVALGNYAHAIGLMELGCWN